MKKPLIGLTPAHNMELDDINIRSSYLKALTAAGLIPILLPLEAENQDLEQLTSMLNGFVFTGGPDIHPFLFGEDTKPYCGLVSPKRDSMEMLLLSHIMKTKKPVLGICRGLQTLNIGLGGTIYQDLSDCSTTSIAHSQPFSPKLTSHKVMLTPNTLLARICAPETVIPVNSMHHQSVKDVAPELVISAVSSDGIIESLELPSHPFFLGVQWHPEQLWEEYPAALSIFKAFAEAVNNIRCP